MKTKYFGDWYSSGRLQKILTFAVYCMLAFLLAYVLEFLCKRLVLNGLGQVLAQYVPAGQINAVEAEIMAGGGDFGPQLFVCVLLLFFLAWAIMKFSTRLNLVGAVELDKALRFADAMENLGLVHDWEQLLFIQRHKIPVYIANQPLLATEAERIKARLYPFSRTLLASTDFMDANKGRKRLCLKAADLDAALAKLNTSTTTTAESPEMEPGGLRRHVAQLETEKKIFQRELLAAQNQITDLEARYKTQAEELRAANMRGRKSENENRRILLYSLALAPILQKIVAAKPDRRDVTKKALGDLFTIALENNAALQGQFISLEQKVPAKLPDYICDLAWAELKDLGLASDGGAAPTGNLGRLKKIVFG